MYQKKLKESVSLRHKAEALNGLGNVMKCQNNYDKASFFFNKEIDIMDSLAQQHQKENVKESATVLRPKEKNQMRIL